MFPIFILLISLFATKSMLSSSVESFEYVNLPITCPFFIGAEILSGKFIFWFMFLASPFFIRIPAFLERQTSTDVSTPLVIDIVEIMSFSLHNSLYSYVLNP